MLGALPELTPITKQNVHKIRLLGPLSYGGASSVAWLPEAHIIAVGTTYGIWLHDAENLRLHPTQLQKTIRTVRDVVFHPTEHWLCSAEDDGAVRFWDVRTRTEVMAFEGHSAPGVKLKFNRDGSTLFVGGSDNRVYVWDVNARELRATLQHEPQSDENDHQTPDLVNEARKIKYVTLSPNEQTLAVGAWLFNPEILLWDVKTGSLIRTLDVMSSFEYVWPRRNLYINRLAFAGDNLLIVNVGIELYEETQVWDVEAGELEDAIGLSKLYSDEPTSTKNIWIPDLSLSKPVYPIRGLEESTYQIRNIKTGELLPELTFDAKETALNKTKNQAVSIHGGSIERWDLGTNQNLDSSALFYNYDHFGAVFSADSRKLAVMVHRYSPGVQLWDIRQGIILDTIDPAIDESFDTRNFGILFKADGTSVLVGRNADNKIQIWDMMRREKLYEFQVPHNDLSAWNEHFEISPNWNYLVSASNDGPIRLWDLHTQQQTILWQREGHIAKRFYFSPKDNYLAAITNARDDYTVSSDLHVFDLGTHQEILTIYPAYKACFSPAEDTLFVTSREDTGDIAQLWNLKTGKQFGSLPGLSIEVDSIPFSQDETLAVIGTEDALEFWDWREQILVHRIPIVSDSRLATLQISPDGKIIVTAAGRLPELRIWGIVADKLSIL